MGCVLEFIKIKCSDNTSQPKYCIQKLFAKMIRLHLISLHFSFFILLFEAAPFFKTPVPSVFSAYFSPSSLLYLLGIHLQSIFPQVAVEKGIKWQQQQQQRISLSKNFTPYELFYLCKCACERKTCRLASPPLFASFFTHAVFAHIRAQELNNFEKLQLSLPRFAWTKCAKTFFKRKGVLFGRDALLSGNHCMQPSGQSKKELKKRAYLTA